MKKLLVILAVVVIATVAFVVLLPKGGYVLEVSVTIGASETQDETRIIKNISAKLVPWSKISEPKGNELVTPGVVVIAKKSKEIISYWTAVPYTGYGNYVMNVGLLKYPNKGDTISIAARVVGPNGKDFDVWAKDVTVE